MKIEYNIRKQKNSNKNTVRRIWKLMAVTGCTNQRFPNRYANWVAIRGVSNENSRPIQYTFWIDVITIQYDENATLI